MLFITTTYGKKYVPFLSVLLYSLEKTHPTDKIVVYWRDIDQIEIDWLKAQFHNASFVKVNGHIDYENINASISQKMEFWSKACSKNRDKYICLIDSDTLVYRNINQFIKGDFDFSYTWKDEKFSINTGVVIVRNSSKMVKFFRLWKDETVKILSDQKTLEEACKLSGAADQQALLNIMRVSDIRKGGRTKFEFGEITFKGIECNILNQTNSVPLNSGSYVLHYKGAWRSIILDGTGYTSKRSRHMSKQMKNLWEQYYCEVNKNKFKDYVIEECSKSMNILPWNKLPLQSRGILHSEMLTVISLIKAMNIDVIIESGRANGQSTEVLAKAFPDKKVVSMELLRDDLAIKVEEKFKRYKNLKLLYGDANTLLWEILGSIKKEKVAILLDGPKGKEAYELFIKARRAHDNVLIGFFHDCRKPYKDMPNPSRKIIHTYFERVFFTDDDDYVKKFRKLDKYIITPMTDDEGWKPHMKGLKKIGSYGPTMGAVIPTYRDIYTDRTQNRSIKERLKSVAIRIINSI